MINRLIDWWERYQEKGARERIQKLEAIKKAELGCFACHNYGDGVKSIISHVWQHGMYASWRETYKYHASCLKDVLENPEKWGTKKVDLALKITEEMSYWAAQIKKGRDILAEQEKDT